MSARLEAHGIAIELPPGWDGRIYRRGGGDATLHAANFPLPMADGDFGSRATERMPPGGSFMALTEYRPGRGLEPGRGLFEAHTLPLPLPAGAFHAHTVQVGRRGQLGFQHFFTSSRRRPFCLYAVIRPHPAGAVAAAGMSPLVSGLSAVLATVAIA